MKQSIRIFCVTVAITMLAATMALADSPFDPTKSMHDNLQALAAGKQTITVVLKTGKEYRGRIGGVDQKAVVLTEISGREFFDVLIPLKAIAAVEAQARQK